MNPQILRRFFEGRLPIFKRLEEEAVFILKSALEKRHIKIHSITSRVKTAQSFSDKVQRKQSSKPFDEITDIVGLRIVCLFLSDIPRIGDTIRDSFTILSEDNKISDYEISSFGYLSVHFVAAIKKEYSGPRYDQILDLPFEIQVRTIAMHAWATVSHYLDYKAEMDVPKDLRRDFYALSGLFYIADTHFEMFFKLGQASREKMIKLFEKAKPKLDQTINLDSLTAYLHKKFPDRKHSRPEYISDLVRDLLKTGHTTIGDIERTVEIAWDAFLLWEKEEPPGDRKPGTKYYDVAVVRGLLALIYHSYSISEGWSIPNKKYKKLLKKIA